MVTKYKLLLLMVFFMIITSCSQTSLENQKYIKRFKGTEVENLVNAINKENTNTIEKLIKERPQLLKYIDPAYGSGVLGISIDLEKYNSFKKLLELGADPNYINSTNRYSILIESIKPFGSDTEWREDNRYAKLLLQYKANPNYIVTNGFEDNKGHYQSGASPLGEASSLNLDMVKELVKYGADINQRVDGALPFGIAVSANKFDIINYYIDSLNIDVKQPLSISCQKPENKITELYIQDYMNKYMDFIPDTKEALKKQVLIKKLESKGVDFKNYKYKK